MNIWFAVLFAVIVDIVEPEVRWVKAGSGNFRTGNKVQYLYILTNTWFAVLFMVIVGPEVRWVMAGSGHFRTGNKVQWTISWRRLGLLSSSRSLSRLLNRKWGELWPEVDILGPEIRSNCTISWWILGLRSSSRSLSRLLNPKWGELWPEVDILGPEIRSNGAISWQIPTWFTGSEVSYVRKWTF